MIVFRRGHVSQFKSVQGILRGHWESIAEQTEAEIARREKAGVPLDELKPLGPYREDPNLEGLRVKLRTVSQAEVAETEIDAKAALELEAKESDKASRDVMRNFVRLVVADIDGVTDENNVPIALDIDETIEVLEDGYALSAVYQAAKIYQALTGAEKKRLGSSGAST